MTNAEFIYNADLCVSPGNVGLTAMHSLVFGCPVITHNCFEWQMPEFEAIQPGITGDFLRWMMWRLLLLQLAIGSLVNRIIAKRCVRLALMRLILIGIHIIR